MYFYKLKMNAAADVAISVFRVSLCRQLACELHLDMHGLLQPNKRGWSIGSVGVCLAYFFPSHGFVDIILYLSTSCTKWMFFSQVKTRGRESSHQHEHEWKCHQLKLKIIGLIGFLFYHVLDGTMKWIDDDEHEWKCHQLKLKIIGLIGFLFYHVLDGTMKWIDDDGFQTVL